MRACDGPGKRCPNTHGNAENNPKQLQALGEIREEAVEIRALLKANPELRLSSNFNLRTAPRFLTLREEIAAGGLGRVYALEGDYLWGRVHKLKTGWRRKMPFYSIILGAGIHMVDLVCWLSGDFALDSVFAAGNRISTEQAGFEHNDFAIITMQSLTVFHR